MILSNWYAPPPLSVDSSLPLYVEVSEGETFFKKQKACRCFKVRQRGPAQCYRSCIRPHPPNPNAHMILTVPITLVPNESSNEREKKREIGGGEKEKKRKGDGEEERKEHEKRRKKQSTRE